MINKLLYFIKERHSAYLKKGEGLPKPWTEDKILQTYKFCNVYRELDTVTIWIRKNIREPYANNPNLWFMLCLARRINWPDTLQEIMDRRAWPIEKYDPEKLLKILDNRTSRKNKVYGNAYMITAEHVIGETKSRATCYSNLLPLWNSRKEIAGQLQDTLEGAFNTIVGKGFAWGPFMTAQVIADLKYTPQLKNASDWWDWAASGPGSRKGLNIVLGRPVEAPWKEVEWFAELQKLSKKVSPLVKKWGMPRLHNQDLQNCLCETFKMVRGYGKERYRG